jgi:hypothetical protein
MTYKLEMQQQADRLRHSCKGMAMTIAPNEPERWPEIEWVLSDMCANIIVYCLTPLTSKEHDHD